MKPPVLSCLRQMVVGPSELEASYKVRTALSTDIWASASTDLWLGFWFIKGNVREQVISYERSPGV